MGRMFHLVLGLVCLLVTSLVSAQSLPIFGNAKRIGRVVTSTVGATSTATQVSTTTVSGMVSWQLCHQPDSPAAKVAVSEAASPITTGAVLYPGSCVSCQNCGPNTLKSMKAQTPPLVSPATMFLQQYGE